MNRQRQEVLLKNPVTNPSEWTPLSKDFFAQETRWVAQNLIGKVLILTQDLNRATPLECPMAFRIVETEAYTQNDPACHAYQKTTGRAATLYKTPGLSYVYLIYGIHYCLNVVTEEEGKGGAVLFRALEPIFIPEGRDFKTNGPGRLTKALGISKVHHEIMLTESNNPLYLADTPYSADNPNSPTPLKVIQTTRIGINKAKDLPWRFYEEQNPWVSIL